MPSRANALREEQLDDSMDSSPSSPQMQRKKRRSLVATAALDEVFADEHQPAQEASQPAEGPNPEDGMNQQDLIAYYTKFVNAAAQSKFSDKHAFTVNLINALPSFVKETEQKRDFNFASCTLDASVKIYVARVDNTHRGTLEMAGSMKSVTGRGGDDSLGEGFGEDGDGDEERRDLKKKRKKKKLGGRQRFIDRKREKLDLSESAVCVDQYYRDAEQELLGAGSGSRKSSLLRGITRKDFVPLDIDEPFAWKLGFGVSKKESNKVGSVFMSDKQKRILQSIINKTSIVTKRAQEELESLEPIVTDIEDPSYTFTLYSTSLSKKMNQGLGVDGDLPNSTLDENLSISVVDRVELESDNAEEIVFGPENDGGHEASGEIDADAPAGPDMDESILDWNDLLGPAGGGKFLTGIRVAGGLNDAVTAMAGLPTFEDFSKWRLRKLRDTTRLTQKQGEEKLQRPRRARVNKDTDIDFYKDLTRFQPLEPGTAAYTRLFHPQIRQRALIPNLRRSNDYKFHHLLEFRMFPSMSVQWEIPGRDKDRVAVETLHEMTTSDGTVRSTDSRLGYLPDHGDNELAIEPLDDANEAWSNVVDHSMMGLATPVGPEKSRFSTATSGISLVEGPLQVGQTQIPYATRDKRVNMKRLKRTAWDIIKETKNSMSLEEFHKEVVFQAPDVLQKDISPHMTFISLLHLCNEHNVELSVESGGPGEKQEVLIDTCASA